MVDGAVYKIGQTNDVVQTTAAGYRLPTDMEWEYAARGGVASRRFPWGDTDTIQHARANYESLSKYSYDTSETRGFHPAYATGAYPYTSPVGSFAPNGYDLYDMAGNAYEWCFDWHPDFEETDRVVRGGSWMMDASFAQIGACSYFPPNYPSPPIGFRAVLFPNQE